MNKFLKPKNIEERSKEYWETHILDAYDISSKQLFEIAKIIDNEYIGKEDYFKIYKTQTVIHLSSTRCDNCSTIKIFLEFVPNEIFDMQIKVIRRLVGDTPGWKTIHTETIKRVNEFLKSIHAREISI